MNAHEADKRVSLCESSSESTVFFQQDETNCRQLHQWHCWRVVDPIALWIIWTCSLEEIVSSTVQNPRSTDPTDNTGCGGVYSIGIIMYAVRTRVSHANAPFLL